MSAFSLKVYTPEGIIEKSLDCDSILVPTEKGEINILPSHTHLLTKLETGVLTAKVSGGESHRYFVTSGVCKVLDHDVTVLSLAAEKSTGVDIERAQRALSEAKAFLSTGSISDSDMIKYERKVNRANIRIQLAK